MKRHIRLATGTFATVGVAAAVYGVWLVTTVDREFAPRGAVGTLSVIFGAILGGFAFATCRHSHKP